ncbi:Uncharacterized protein OBRU01_14192 [Operophtera brumata]|uniref:Dynein heavy chain tail domain-containing protein n=1 Tax=Operophtera brumata TaxID=104452 RepID=A0A0L7KU59_OPEBR|nr:Uncharacterized protein OBRU01_14192 [Operophtera brumata]
MMEAADERPFDCSEMYVFGKFDTFKRRLLKIVDLFQTYITYYVLNKTTLEGIEEYAANFNKLFKSISTKTYDALDHRRPDFDKDYKIYKDNVANQEVLLENFMITSVNKCPTTEIALHLLKRFETLKLGCLYLEDQYYVLISTYTAEIETLRDRYNEERENPELPRNMPPVAGRVMWIRFYDNNIKRPMETFVGIPEVIDHMVRLGLIAPLLIRHPRTNMYIVNFSVYIPECIREVEYMWQLGLYVPDGAQIVAFCKEKILGSYERIMHLVNRNNLIRSFLTMTTDPEEQKKLSPLMLTEMLLQIPKILIKPSLEEIQLAFSQVGSRSGSTMGGLRSYFRMVSEHKDVVRAVMALQGMMYMFKPDIEKLLQNYCKFSQLWAEDRVQQVQVFVDSNPLNVVIGDMLKIMDVELDLIIESYDLFAQFNIDIPKEDADKVYGLRYAFQNMLITSAQVQQRIVEMQGPLQQELTQGVACFCTDVLKFDADYELRGPMAPGLTAREASDRVIMFQSRFEELWRKFEMYSNGEKLFGMEVKDYPILHQKKKEFSLLSKLYSLYLSVMNSIDGYFETPWNGIDIELIISQLAEFDLR